MGMREQLMIQMTTGKTPERMINEWGIPYIGNKEGQGGMLPEPGKFILKDIHDWKKVIKTPPVLDTSDSWWADKAKKDLETSKIDRTQSLAQVGALLSPFTTFIGFMGFTEGLCALYEEPEEVKELLNWMVDFYAPVQEKIIKYYEPEVFAMGDDTATRYNPFFSVEMYKDVFKPIYVRLSKPYTDKGIFVEFHNCGRCEDFVPDMCDFGVKAWDPAQTDNDLVAAKTQHDISILGGYDFVPPADSNVTEEMVRESARKTFAKYAPGGRYAFAGGLMAPSGDPRGPQWNGWLRDEVAKLCDCYYDK
jgi:hypothetical protein